MTFHMFPLSRHSARILQDSGDVVDVQAAGVGANEASYSGTVTVVEGNHDDNDANRYTRLNCILGFTIDNDR